MIDILTLGNSYIFLKSVVRLTVRNVIVIKDMLLWNGIYHDKLKTNYGNLTSFKKGVQKLRKRKIFNV